MQSCSSLPFNSHWCPFLIQFSEIGTAMHHIAALAEGKNPNDNQYEFHKHAKSFSWLMAASFEREREQAKNK